MSVDPLKCSPTVIICCRERVFWGEPVFHGNNYDLDLGDKVVEVGVVHLRESGFKQEATAMEVDQDGEFGVVRFWKIKTSRDGGVV